MAYLFSVLSVCSVVRSFFARIAHIRAYIRRDDVFLSERRSPSDGHGSLKIKYPRLATGSLSSC